MEERFNYGLNPKKLGALSSYLCDPATAPAEFLLVKSQYQAEMGRAVERGALFFQIRQAFPPGEVTAEEANQIGYETAMRWTKGKYQFFVCTHTDKSHLHNHIYFNSTAFDRSRKFHNFIGSSFALRRLSDRVCVEHDLSVIQNPKQHSKGRYLHYGQWIGEKPPSAKQRVRLAIVEALKKQPADFPAFAEQRYVQQVVAEERSQRNVPTLPELSDVLAEERVAEVFVQMKAEDAGNANCHIGIAGEIEVHLQGVENYTVPDTQCGLGGEVVPQELVYDAGEPVCQYDLFAQTNGNTHTCLLSAG